MLLICCCSFNGNGPSAQELHVFHLGFVASFQRGGRDRVQTVCQLCPDTPPDHEVWEVAIVEQRINDCVGHHIVCQQVNSCSSLERCKAVVPEMYEVILTGVDGLLMVLIR